MHFPNLVDIQEKTTTYSGTTWTTQRSQKCKIQSLGIKTEEQLAAIGADISHRIWFRDRPIVKIGQRALFVKFSHDITAVSTGDKKFTIAGDFTSEIDADKEIRIANSTGNDGIYTVVSATLSGGNTEVVVTETVSDGTADGVLQVLTKYEIKGVRTKGRYQEARAIERQ